MLSDFVGYVLGRRFGLLMLPHSDHQPAESFEPTVRVSISAAVAVYLLGPEISMRRFWESPMQRTSMPKAPIHENCHTGSEKHDIDFSTEPRN